MIVGVLTVELTVPDARSLKDKRRVVLGIKQKLRNKFNVSVAETRFQDQHRRCQLGVAVVSNEARMVDAQLDQVINTIRGARGLLLLEYHREIY